MSNLNPVFFTKLKEMSRRLGVNPADLLLIFYQESGLNPESITPKTVGLNQFFGDFKDHFIGTREEFASLDAEDQLPAIESFFKSIITGPVLSAAHLYLYNFLPAVAMKIHSADPNLLLGEKGNNQKILPNSKSKLTYHQIYNENKSLDFDKDNKITFGDLEKILAKKANEKGYLDALSQLNDPNAAPTINAEDEGKDDEVKPPPGKQGVIVAFIEKMIKAMQDAIDSLS